MRERGLDLQIWQVRSGDEGPDTTRWPQVLRLISIYRLIFTYPDLSTTRL